MVNVSKVASTELATPKTLLNDGFLRKTENVELEGLLIYSNFRY